MSDFEQIPEIAERIKRSKMELKENGFYWSPEWDSQSCCDQDFVNNFKKGWNARQGEIDQLKAQLNNMEACYIEKKKQVEGALSRIESLMVHAAADYENTKSTSMMCAVQELGKALRGAND